jgi:hypothetical protein
MPKEPTTRGGSSRQRPISCLFCRSRKLRCSREAPCTNCKSRGIECELETLARSSTHANGPSKADLLERVRLLEELVKKGTQDTRPASSAQSLLQNDNHIVETEPKSAMTHDVERLESDVAWLTSIYDGAKLSVSITHFARFTTNFTSPMIYHRTVSVSGFVLSSKSSKPQDQ